MRQCIIDLRKGRQLPRKFLEECRKRGCRLQLRGCREAEAKDTLILTDSQKTVFWASERGIACVGYECTQECAPLSGVELVVQDLEILTFSLLERAYRRFHGIPWEIARTDRLLIRESIAEDFEALYAMCQETDFCRYTPGMTGDREEEREGFLTYIKNMYAFYEYGLWTVLERATGQVVGRVGLENRDTLKGKVLEAGYAIGRPWQNLGYATEAMEQVFAYAARELGEEQVFAYIQADNLPSLKVAKKLGMKEISSGCFCKKL